MAAVMIGVDPHKGSHTAVAIGADEVPVGLVRVRACAAQAERLLTWAKSWPERIWAVEGAAGLGHLLAQQLVAAGERVLDVQPKLAARVRLLATGAGIVGIILVHGAALGGLPAGQAPMITRRC
jgi:transposase